jgi:Ca2+/H+ antiporter
MIFAFKIGFLEVTWVDLVDISLVAILLYQVYKLIRGSLAVNIFLGILALVPGLSDCAGSKDGIAYNHSGAVYGRWRIGYDNSFSARD